MLRSAVRLDTSPELCLDPCLTAQRPGAWCPCCCRHPLPFPLLPLARVPGSLALITDQCRHKSQLNHLLHPCSCAGGPTGERLLCCGHNHGVRPRFSSHPLSPICAFCPVSAAGAHPPPAHPSSQPEGCGLYRMCCSCLWGWVNGVDAARARAPHHLSVFRTSCSSMLHGPSSQQARPSSSEAPARDCRSPACVAVPLTSLCHVSCVYRQRDAGL